MHLLTSPQNGVESHPEGFQFLTFTNARLTAGMRVQGETGKRELCLVVLGGTCSVASSRGEWKRIGRRADVFSGMPYAVYLPIATAYTVTAETDCDLGLCFCKAEEQFPARLITPADIETEIRGGANATRQINKIIQPEFAAHRLL